MTLVELKSELQSFTDCTEAGFVAQLNNIIQQAERSIYAKVLMPDAKNGTFTIDTADGVDQVTVTGAIAALLRVYISGRNPLVRKQPAYIRQMFSNCANGVPINYAWMSSTDASTHLMLLGPKPNGVYSMNFEFARMDFPSLVATTGGTMLSTNWPEALRKAALVECGLFLKTWDTAQFDKMKAEAAEAIGGLVSIYGSPQVDEVRQ